MSTTKKYKWRIKNLKIRSESGETLELTAGRKKTSCVLMDDMSLSGLKKLKDTLEDALIEAKIKLAREQRKKDAEE